MILHCAEKHLFYVKIHANASFAAVSENFVDLGLQPLQLFLPPNSVNFIAVTFSYDKNFNVSFTGGVDNSILATVDTTLSIFCAFERLTIMGSGIFQKSHYGFSNLF